ncbi:MAG: putative nucleotidyltransferase substrate binding domain-containing protein [Syntrophotaleaceae bacterium]
MTPSKQLRSMAPFDRLPETIVREILAAARVRSFSAGDVIFEQDDPATGFLYIVKKGLVEITALTPGGIDLVVEYRREGEFFGEMPVFSDESYSGGARAARETECYLIPSEQLRQAEQRHPQLREYFTGAVLFRVQQLYAEIVADHTRSALAHLEAYPFQKRLSEIMSSPVATCGAEESVQEVARRMVEKKISSVVVVDDSGRPAGLVTERDLVTKVIAPGQLENRNLSAGQIMAACPFSMSPDAYMYEAMSYMLGHRLKHLPVVDGGETVGMVTLSDLMRYRSQKAMLLLGSIREENSLAGLALIRQEIVEVARALLSEIRTLPEVMEILSYIHYEIIRRVYELCEREMIAAGFVKPAIRHCFLIMGSGGRREMLLNPDQDNGFVYENLDDDRLTEVEGYFMPFSEKLVTALAEVGYPLCEGKVMANNPAWRGRLCDWQARVRGWVSEPEPQNVRTSSIFFDFTALVGDAGLVHDLRSIVYQEMHDYPGFLYHMMTLDLQYRVPLGLLGRFLVEKSGPQAGKLSLKLAGSIYLVDCIRMFCLEQELQELETLKRLKALVARSVFATETAEHIEAAFEALVFLRLRNEIAQVDAGKSPNHFIDPQALSKNEQSLLRASFQAVRELQEATKRHFGRTVL